MHRWLMSDRRFIASFPDSANMSHIGSTVLPINASTQRSTSGSCIVPVLLNINSERGEVLLGRLP
jgi:hypothetical protein